MHAGHPRRARRRAGRTERRRQDHVVEPGGWPHRPSAGSITVLGGARPGSPAALDGIAFVAQDAPLYKNLSAADMLHLTRNLNRRFDRVRRSPAGRAGHPVEAKAGNCPAASRRSWH